MAKNNKDSNTDNLVMQDAGQPTQPGPLDAPEQTQLPSTTQNQVETAQAEQPQQDKPAKDPEIAKRDERISRAVQRLQNTPGMTPAKALNVVLKQERESAQEREASKEVEAASAVQASKQQLQKLSDAIQEVDENIAYARSQGIDASALEAERQQLQQEKQGLMDELEPAYDSDPSQFDDLNIPEMKVIKQAKALETEKNRQIMAEQAEQAAKAQEAQEESIKLQAQTEIEKEKLRPAIAQKNAAEQLQAEEAAKRQPTIDEQLDRIRRMREEVVNTPFKSYWEDKSTADKILAGLAIYFGALGQGLGGGENQGSKVIFGAIDKHLENQKLNKKQKLEALDKSLEVVKFELERKESLETSQVRKLKMQQLKQQMELQQEAARQQIVQQAMFEEARKRRESGNIRIEDLTKEERDRVVRMPDGSIQLADNKQRASEVAKYVNETQPAVEEVAQMIDDIKSGRYSRLSIGDRASLASRRRILAGNLRVAIVGPGAMTEKEYERLLNIIGDPNAFVLRGAERRKLEALETTLMRNVNQRYKSAGIKPPIFMGGKQVKAPAGMSAKDINEANVKQIMRNAQQRGDKISRSAAEKTLKNKNLWAE